MSSSSNSRPSRFRGWWWTLTKCGLTTVALAFAATAALYAVLRDFAGRLPGWLPSAWGRWLFDWTFRHVWFVGPLLGVILGAVVSVGIVVFDAKRGRLKRVV